MSLNFHDYITHDAVDGDCSITIELNKQASVSGYSLNTTLYEKAVTYSKFNVPLSDLDINILLINFVKYYVRSQYHIFVYQFEELLEIENFEQKLLKCSQSFIKLPKNLAVHEIYGLKAFHEQFPNSGSMSVYYFEQILSYMSSKSITPGDFVKYVTCIYKLYIIIYQL